MFPWGYTIIHYINGDTKQIIQLSNKIDLSNPFRMEIYYAKNNCIIEYVVGDRKKIHFFLNEDQIEHDRDSNLKDLNCLFVRFF